MRATRGNVVALVVSVVALVLLAGALDVVLAVEPPRTAASAKPLSYKLPPEGLQGLPTALVLEQATPRGSQVEDKWRESPLGSQEFPKGPEAKADGYRMFLQAGPMMTPDRLVFRFADRWTFLPGAKFEQRDAKGNRLLLEDGKAQVFNSKGVQLGALQTPSLGDLYRRLLKLTM